MTSSEKRRLARITVRGKNIPEVVLINLKQALTNDLQCYDESVSDDDDECYYDPYWDERHTYDDYIIATQNILRFINDSRKYYKRFMKS